MADAKESAQDRQARERIEKCIAAMSVSTRHKRLAGRLLKLLDHKGGESEAKNVTGRTIDI